MSITDECFNSIAVEYRLTFGEDLDMSLYKDLMSFYGKGILEGMRTGKSVDIMGMGKFNPSLIRERKKNSRTLAPKVKKPYLCLAIKEGGKNLLLANKDDTDKQQTNDNRTTD